MNTINNTKIYSRSKTHLDDFASSGKEKSKSIFISQEKNLVINMVFTTDQVPSFILFLDQLRGIKTSLILFNYFQIKK